MFQRFERSSRSIYVGQSLFEGSSPSLPLSLKPSECFFDSKWFLDALGHEGLNNLLLAYEDKGATAVCTFAYCKEPGNEPMIFEGRVQV